MTGTTVLDFSQYLPGPALTRALLDLGAQVIKVEGPGGDPTRFMEPRVDGVSTVYADLNRGKRCVRVDLKKPGGSDFVLALAAQVDVVVESFRPGVMDRLGLGFAALRDCNRKLILCSISGYGQRGPLAHKGGHDINYAARAGILGLWRQDVTPGVQMADIAGGTQQALSAVLAALLQVARTGEGRHLDVSMTHGVAALGSFDWSRTDADPTSAGILRGDAPAYRMYETADGRAMALGALEPKFFLAFCQRAEVPHLASEGFAAEPRRSEVIRELAALFRSRTQREWVNLLDGCDCCCEPVLTPAEAAADPALCHMANADLFGSPLRQRPGLTVASPGQDNDWAIDAFDLPADAVQAARAGGAL